MAQESSLPLRTNMNLFSPETSSLRDFLNNIETNIIPHGLQKAFKHALYNGLAVLLITTCYAVYLILNIFLKPLLWALITGTVLFPMKKLVANHLKFYIKSMKSHSMLFQTVYVPVLVMDSVSDFIGNKVYYIYHLPYTIPIVVSSLVFSFIYVYVPSILVITMYLISTFISTTYSIIYLLQHFSVILLLCIALVSILYFQKVPPTTTTVPEDNVSENKALVTEDLKYSPVLKILSLFIWFALACYLTTFFGPFIQSVLLIFIQLTFLAGCLYDWYYDDNEEPELNDNEQQISSSSPPIEPPTSPLSTRDQQQQQQQESIHTSDSYIYWVVCCCVVAAVLQNLYLMFIFILFELIYLVKRACGTFGLYDSMFVQLNKLKSHCQAWYQPRRGLIFPAPLNNIRKMNIIWRHWCLSMFQDSSDALASVLVILGIIFVLIFATLFFIIQAYSETFHMVKLGGNIINQTVVHNPEVMQYLPDGWEEQLDSVLNNTYTYGRVGISKMIASLLKDVKKEKAAEFESTALELWDRIYQAWLMSALEPDKTAGPKVSSGAVSQSWTTFLEHIQKTPELMSIKTLSLLVNNMSLGSGLQSVWVLLKANMGLAVQALTTLVSLVFESGFAVFNFIINIVVFLTALFYLLSSSDRLYKPVQIITDCSPIYGKKLAVAIETAVHEVLTASFKLALFYGLWTWLIHSLFQVQLVYIPSAFASILAAIPILGPYWACIPGVLDLYLVQGNPIKALVLVLFQILPTFFVDAAIYNEIQGGHPYLTGLSVAGGVFWLGIEGAIIGPLLLCCLFVIVNMSTAIMRENMVSSPSA